MWGNKMTKCNTCGDVGAEWLCNECGQIECDDCKAHHSESFPECEGSDWRELE